MGAVAHKMKGLRGGIHTPPSSHREHLEVQHDAGGDVVVHTYTLFRDDGTFTMTVQPLGHWFRGTWEPDAIHGRVFIDVDGLTVEDV